jgi:hypothetical protein
MATTTWGLTSVDYDVSDGFCDRAYWTVVRVDGDYSTTSCGTAGLTKPETLTDRTDLKTADIIADVKAVLGSDKVKAIEDGLIAQIDQQKTPVKGSFVPSS